MFSVASPKAPSKRTAADTAYERRKDRAQLRSRRQSQHAREISGDFPAVTAKNRRLRAQVLADFEKFCKVVFREVFYLPFSDDHRKVISKMTIAATSGGLFALAMPRGSGKTALCIALCLWSVLKGLHEFVVLIGATKEGAVEILDGLRTQLETNDVLLDLFPEVCYPIRRLEGVSQRRLLWKGQPIKIKFTANRLILPSLPPNKAASAIIGVAGITGRIRGMKFTRPDRREVRPSLAVIDDPQDDESANSPSQCDRRERIVSGTVLGLPAPGKKIAVVMPCTVICERDLAHRMLDRKSHPDWHGEKMKLLYAFPKNEARWTEYAEIRHRCQREDRPIDEANDYYAVHRVEMDDGAIPAWPERFNVDELSAVQHAMNLKLRDELAFMAECQQEPVSAQGDEQKPTLAGLPERVNRLPRGILPIWTSKLVSFIDVHDNCLFYVVAALDDFYTCHIPDYGAEPDQARDYFTLRDAKRTLADALSKSGKEGGIEAAIVLGLERLTGRLLGQAWKREDGAEMRIDRCLIDSGYVTNLVYEFCRRSPHAAVLIPSKGTGIKAGDKPMNEWPLKPHERPGFNIVLTSDPVKRAVRLLKFDTNFFKTFAAHRVATPGRGGMTVFGADPLKHRLLTDHLTAETCTKTFGRGRSVWEWKLLPGRDNHLLDGVTGCLAAASQLGCRLREDQPPTQKKKSSIPAHMIAGRAL